jgi:hypothetical protein
MGVKTKMARMHISAQGDKPNATQKRQIGKYNWGFYCTKCNEFFAFAVADNPPAEPIEFISDGEPLWECPLCHHPQRRQVSEIASLYLTEATKRKPPIPPGVH